MPIKRIRSYISDKRRSRVEVHVPGELRVSPMARIILKSMLLENETILSIAMVSYGIYWKSAAVLCLAIILFLFAPPLGVFVLLVSVVMFAMAYMTQDYLLLAATDKRVVLRFGIMNQEIIQMRYSKIESTEVFTTLMGYFFNYSSVVINGVGGRRMMIPYIANSASIRNRITEILVRREDLEEQALEEQASG